MKYYITLLFIIGIATSYGSLFDGMKSIEINGITGYIDETPTTLAQDVSNDSLLVIDSEPIFEGDVYSKYWGSYETDIDISVKSRLAELEKELLELKNIIKSLEARLQKLEQATSR